MFVIKTVPVFSFFDNTVHSFVPFCHIDQAMSSEIPNFYELIGKKYTSQSQPHPGWEATKMRVPCRCILYGPAGSGKNNALLAILTKMCFVEYYICAKNFDQPLWKFFIDKIRTIEKKIEKPILFLCSQPKELPDIDLFVADGKQRVFVYDDCLTASKKEYDMIAKAWVYGRNLGISTFFLAQAWTPIARVIRLNSDYIVIKRLNSLSDLRRIIADASIDKKPEELYELYKAATNTMNSFFLIDKVTTEPHLMFRWNFG